jgi:sugar diacid utilization regulator
MLTRNIAEEIVRETMKRLNRNINIMNEHGSILPLASLPASIKFMKGPSAQRVLLRLTPKLIDTLEAFFACNFHIAETAQALFVHRNTLIYRLGQIKEKTGYDPQRFQDALVLQLAIWIRRL